MRDAPKHVIIDEAQDNMNIGSFELIWDIFGKKHTRSISLTKSYRSSKEIADFFKQLLSSSKHSEQLNRHGSKPKIVKVDRGNLYKRIAGDIIQLKSRQNKLIVFQA